MAIFRRNRGEEYVDEEEILKEEERKDRKLTKKFRDLNPKNKKKRKEPPKPWGIRERIFLLSILLITTFSAAVFAFSARENKLPNIPRFAVDLSNFKFGNPFGEAVIEIGQKGHFDAGDEKAKQVVTLFNQEIKPVPGVYGFDVIRLGDGSSYGVSDSEKFQGASLLKLPLLILLYKEADSGRVNLATRYILKNSDKVIGSGPLDNIKAGTVLTYRQLAEFMGRDSDRTAYKIVKNILGDTAFAEFIKSQEMKDTNIATGDTTPDDMAKILQNLYEGKIVSEKSKDEIYSLLTDTIYENWITKGVPSGVRVVHKFGTDLGIMTDAGIVFAKKPYILIIMSKGITQSDADKIFPEISKDVWNTENDVK